MLGSYWKITQGKADVLEAIRLCHVECSLSAGDIKGYPEFIKLDPVYVPEKRTIERILASQQSIQSAGHVLGLLLVAHDVFARVPSPSAEMKTLAARLAAHMTTLKSNLGEQFPAVSFTKKIDPPPPPVPPAVDVVGLIQQFLQVPSASFGGMNREFFPELNANNLPANSEMRFFNMYRFHSSPKKIVKTFTVVKSPIASRPFSMFTNFFVSTNGADPRRSNGIIIPTKDFLYLIGGLDGTGLKLIALERWPHGKLGMYHGLTITFDESEVMVAARCFLLPTDAVNHIDAGAGIYAIDKLDFDARNHLDELRNRIPFELENSLKLDNEVISQRAMVHAVSRILGAPAKPRLVFEDEREFNPADHDTYTFNAALRAWH